MTNNIEVINLKSSFDKLIQLFLTLLTFITFLLIQGCESDIIESEESFAQDSILIKEEAKSIGQEDTNNISYYDDLIVFHFPESYTTGQYANGDYWVYNNGNDVTITEMTPISKNNNGRIINGAMVNPKESSDQGYDSNPRDMKYENALNMDPGNTNIDLVVPPGSSVVKSISTASTSGRPIISDAAILTVVNKIPLKGSFRPPYTGADKTVIATTSDLNYNALGNHARLGGEPDIEAVTHFYDKVWLEHCTEWTARDIHPANHMPAYGRDLANKSATGLLLLQLDYTNEEKEQLLINLVQYGIDIYGIARTRGVWYNNGGHNLGRKMPLLLAAKVLNNENMLAYADKEQHFIFQDDQQHFYVSQAEVTLSNSDAWNPDSRATPTPYEASDICLAEWGIRHADRPQFDNKNWGATYRLVNGYAQTSHIFAARLMGVENEWNWSPVFDYTDRFYDIESHGFEPYIAALWEAYR